MKKMEIIKSLDVNYKCKDIAETNCIGLWLWWKQQQMSHTEAACFSEQRSHCAPGSPLKHTIFCSASW